MIFKRVVMYLDKHTNTDIKKVNGVYSDYVLKLGDAEIRLHEEVLKKLYEKIEGIYNGKKIKKRKERDLN